MCDKNFESLVETLKEIPVDELPDATDVIAMGDIACEIPDGFPNGQGPDDSPPSKIRARMDKIGDKMIKTGPVDWQDGRE